MGGLREARAGAGDRGLSGPVSLVEELTDEPAGLVAPEPPGDGLRHAVLVNPRRRALVLGSAQRPEVIDRAACAVGGWSVVRRRSGGAAVVVAPGAQVWLDVFLPAGDGLLEREITRSGLWLGELWAEALREAGLSGPVEVHRGALVHGRFSRVACFSSLGPGEVTWGGRKVVGCSQRRTRAGAWLHTMALVEDLQGELCRLLDLPAGERSTLAAVLASSSGAVPLDAGVLSKRLTELLTDGRR